MTQLMLTASRPTIDRDRVGQMTAHSARLLSAAELQLRSARRAGEVYEKFTYTHFSVLRLVGAVLAVVEVGRRVPRGQSPWNRLVRFVPELGPWSSVFATASRLRASMDAGNFDAVSAEQAEQWLGLTEDFRADIFAWFGLDPLVDFDSQAKFVA